MNIDPVKFPDLDFDADLLHQEMRRIDLVFQQNRNSLNQTATLLRQVAHSHLLLQLPSQDSLRECLDAFTQSLSIQHSLGYRLLDPTMVKLAYQRVVVFNLVKPLIGQFQAAIDSIVSSQVLECLQTIQVCLRSRDPLWNNLTLARDGDRLAAGRLSFLIPWQPGPLYRGAIRLRAKCEGVSTERVHREALIQGVILALRWEKDASIPFLVKPTKGWAYNGDEIPACVCPYQLEEQLFWEWVKEESCRAAELWLVGQAYAPTVVLEEPPSEDGEFRLARFTSVSARPSLTANRGGRPLGSGKFQDRDAFLQEIRRAAAEIAGQGDRVTQSGVANILFQRSLVSDGDPERQLRAWLGEFGFASWRELMQHV